MQAISLYGLDVPFVALIQISLYGHVACAAVRCLKEVMLTKPNLFLYNKVSARSLKELCTTAFDVDEPS